MAPGLPALAMTDEHTATAMAAMITALTASVLAATAAAAAAEADAATAGSALLAALKDRVQLLKAVLKVGAIAETSLQLPPPHACSSSPSAAPAPPAYLQDAQPTVPLDAGPPVPSCVISAGVQSADTVYSAACSQPIAEEQAATSSTGAPRPPCNTHCHPSFTSSWQRAVHILPSRRSCSPAKKLPCRSVRPAAQWSLH